MLLLTGFGKSSVAAKEDAGAVVSNPLVIADQGMFSAGGDCTVVNLPDEVITGNSHFMFQELNSEEIANHLSAWLALKGLN